MTAADDVLGALKREVYGYKHRRYEPQKALVPRWMVDRFGAEAVESEARAFGFDGYEVYEELGGDDD